MRICVIGTGYVGLVAGACLANVGHMVSCVDSDKTRIEELRRGIIPFYEPGLSEMVAECGKIGSLRFFETLPEAFEKGADICYIAVGTPQAADGSAELSYVEQASRDIGRYAMGDIIVVNKSTVPIGSAERVRAWVDEELSIRGESHKVRVVSNPEFLQEGSAVNNFRHPDRIILGTEDPEVIRIMRELYSYYNKRSDRIIVMDSRSAEMTKYAANAMLAARVSFMNEMAGICEKAGANVDSVRMGVGADLRIGRSFLYAGCGYGGSCFPKDVSMLIHTAKTLGVTPNILEAVKLTNDSQKKLIARKITGLFGEDLSGISLAVWGLSFKPNTDDIRCAPSLDLINEVTERGGKVRAFDPKAMDNAKAYFADNPGVSFFSSKYEAVSNADTLAVMTEWNEFKNPDLEELSLRLRLKAVFDGRNIYDKEQMAKHGIRLYQIGM